MSLEQDTLGRADDVWKLLMALWRMDQGGGAPGPEMEALMDKAQRSMRAFQHARAPMYYNPLGSGAYDRSLRKRGSSTIPVIEAYLEMARGETLPRTPAGQMFESFVGPLYRQSEAPRRRSQKGKGGGLGQLLGMVIPTLATGGLSAIGAGLPFGEILGGFMGLPWDVSGWEDEDLFSKMFGRWW